MVAVVDGGFNEQMAKEVVAQLSQLCDVEAGNRKKMELLQEVQDCERLASWLLKIHCSLGTEGESLGASALVASIAAPSTLRVARTGTVQAALVQSFRLVHLFPSSTVDNVVYRQLREANATVDEVRDVASNVWQNNLINGVCPCARMLGFSSLYPAVRPKPQTVELPLSTADECLVIGSGALWSTVPEDLVLEILSHTKNPQVASKKLQVKFLVPRQQDAVEAFGHTGNVSILVVHFTQSEKLFEGGEAKCEWRSPMGGEDALRHIEERLERISEVCQLHRERCRRLRRWKMRHCPRVATLLRTRRLLVTPSSSTLLPVGASSQPARPFKRVSNSVSP